MCLRPVRDPEVHDPDERLEEWRASSPAGYCACMAAPPTIPTSRILRNPRGMLESWPASP